MVRGIHMASLVVLIGCSSIVAQRRDGKIKIIKKQLGIETRAMSPSRGGVDEKTKNILAIFLKMLSNFFSIVQDPKNSLVVTESITNMLAGAVHIVAEGVKSGEFLLDDEEAVQEYAYTVSKRISLPLVRMINV